MGTKLAKRTAPAPAPAFVRYPARPPGDLIECVDFLEALNLKMRELRDASALPRTAVTLPDEFDDIYALTLSEIRRQAQEGLVAGAPLVEARMPVSDDLIALARWSEERIELLSALTRAGMVQAEWRKPLELTLEIFQSVVAQLPA